MKIFVYLGLLVCVSAFADNSTPTNPPPVSVARPAGTNDIFLFADVATRYFGEWDSNGDGVLSKDEIDRAVLNPVFHGEAAAAIAAIKTVVRSDKYDLPPLTRDYLVASPLREPGVSADPTVPPAGPVPKKISHPPAFQPRYRACLQRLRRASRELFPQALPALAACHQGPLGDCYLISVVGAMVHRDPAAIKAMFTSGADGATQVAFGNGRSFNVRRLTDAEIAISSSAGTNGLWLAVLENAYGKANGKPESDPASDKPETDTIAHGGKPRTVINTIAGHQTRSFNLTRHRDESREPQFPAQLGKAISEALKSREIVAAVTPTNTVMPPGVNAKHAYAILGYDADRGLVHVWNPHGNRFKPKGPESREYGYATQNGEFDLPLKDLIQIFSAVVIESPALVGAKPAAAAVNLPPVRPPGPSSPASAEIRPGP